MTTIVVSGALANKCHSGGEAWVRLSWIRGFQRLGCDTYFVEQIAPAHCRDADGTETHMEHSVAGTYFRQVAESFGLMGKSVLVEQESRCCMGMSWPELQDVAGRADLLVNISGHLALDGLFDRFRLRAYIDIDPGFTQIWHATGNPGAKIAGHHAYFTIGENIGRPECPIPIAGIHWRPIRQPVVLDDWPIVPACRRPGFTTIATWRGPFGPLQFGETTYGLKVHQFRRYIEVPRRAAGPFEIALDIHPADGNDLQALHANGWKIEDPRRVAGDPDSFRRYVQESAAEFSVAQGVYVDTRSGWFSDRSVRYLASGKPVLVQDTGLDRLYPVGEGLVTFRTPDEAFSSAECIWADYTRHSQAARRLAEDFFDSDRVLAPLLRELNIPGHAV